MSGVNGSQARFYAVIGVVLLVLAGINYVVFVSFMGTPDISEQLLGGTWKSLKLLHGLL